MKSLTLGGHTVNNFNTKQFHMDIKISGNIMKQCISVHEI